MFDTINQKLEENRKGMDRYQRLGSKLADYRKQLEELEVKRYNLQQQLTKEEEEYDSLFKKNLNNLVLDLLNKKEKKETKEYQDVVTAKLKLDEAEKQVANILLSIRSLEEERVQYSECEGIYHKLYAEKYRLLSESNPENTEKMKDLEKQINFHTKNLTEIEEALRAGRLVHDKITEVRKSLDDAHGWGTFDLLGGGLLSDMMKHSHLDDAQESIDEVQSLLHQFHSELADIQINENISIQIEGFTKFADFFFDGIFSDWMVQSKINSSIQAVSDLETKVDRVIYQLHGAKTSSEASLAQAKQELDNFIKNTI